MAAVTEATIEASRQEVFAVLVDPRTYPEWLVGAERIRGVDGTWPEPGAAFHHEVGFGPLRVRDRTTVMQVDVPNLFELEASAGAYGAARVRFELEPDGPHTVLRFSERPNAGPAGLLWAGFTRGLMRLGLRARNDVSMQRLQQLIDHRSEDRP